MGSLTTLQVLNKHITDYTFIYVPIGCILSIGNVKDMMLNNKMWFLIQLQDAYVNCVHNVKDILWNCKMLLLFYIHQLTVTSCVLCKSFASSSVDTYYFILNIHALNTATSLKQKGLQKMNASSNNDKGQESFTILQKSRLFYYIQTVLLSPIHYPYYS